jgi:hypothetical protein
MSKKQRTDVTRFHTPRMVGNVSSRTPLDVVGWPVASFDPRDPPLPKQPRNQRRLDKTPPELEEFFDGWCPPEYEFACLRVTDASIDKVIAQLWMYVGHLSKLGRNPDEMKTTAQLVIPHLQQAQDILSPRLVALRTHLLSVSKNDGRIDRV